MMVECLIFPTFYAVLNALCGLSHEILIKITQGGTIIIIIIIFSFELKNFN